jgi:hypothetical protein
LVLCCRRDEALPSWIGDYLVCIVTTFESACESLMSAIGIQTLFRCVSETSVDWCGREGVHCDVVIAQTNDTWGHIAGHATSIHLLLIVGSAQF